MGGGGQHEEFNFEFQIKQSDIREVKTKSVCLMITESKDKITSVLVSIKVKTALLSSALLTLQIITWLLFFTADKLLYVL